MSESEAAFCQLEDTGLIRVHLGSLLCCVKNLDRAPLSLLVFGSFFFFCAQRGLTQTCHNWVFIECVWNCFKERMELN